MTSGSDKVRSDDLNGKLVWEFKGMSAITIPTPFVSEVAASDETSQP